MARKFSREDRPEDMERRTGPYSRADSNARRVGHPVKYRVVLMYSALALITVFLLLGKKAEQLKDAKPLTPRVAPVTVVGKEVDEGPPPRHYLLLTFSDADVRGGPQRVAVEPRQWEETTVGIQLIAEYWPRLQGDGVTLIGLQEISPSATSPTQ